MYFCIHMQRYIICVWVCIILELTAYVWYMHISSSVAYKLLVLLTEVLHFVNGIVAEVEIIQIMQVLFLSLTNQIVIEKVAYVQHTITVHALRKDP